MKITSVKTMNYSYPVKNVFGNSGKWNTSRNCVIVAVETDVGITGYGESDAAGGPTSVTAQIVREELAPRIIGMDPLCREEIWLKSYKASMIHGRRGAVVAALSGIDVALWDITGKALGQPIYKLLGGARQKVLAYHSGGFYRQDVPDEWYAEEARRGKEAGFRAFKMKIGRYSQQHDANRVRLVREAIGPDAKLMVDANSSYTAKEAIAMAKRLEPYDIFFFEEPVSANDPAGSARVAAATTIAIAGYETEHTRYGFLPLIAGNAVDVVQCDVIRSGGYTECSKISALASAYQLPCTAHIFSSGLSLLANLHFVTGVENGFMLECEPNENPLRTNMFKDFHLELDAEGYVSVPEAPGLGATIDFDAIEPYRIG